MAFAKGDHSLSGELVRIEQNNTVVFKTKMGAEYKAKAPEIVVPLLEKNKTYVVSIRHKKWGAPRLVSIKDVPTPAE